MAVPFSFIAEEYSIHIFSPFLHWWNLSCFHILTIVNNAAITGVHVFQILRFFSDVYPGVELLSHMVDCLSQWLHQFTSPPTVHEAFLPTFFSVLSLFLRMVILTVVIPHCGFDLHFPDDEWCWASFHVPVGHSVSSLEKRLFSSSAHFVCFFMLSHMNCIYRLNINPLGLPWWLRR